MLSRLTTLRLGGGCINIESPPQLRSGLLPRHGKVIVVHLLLSILPMAFLRVPSSICLVWLCRNRTHRLGPATEVS